MEVNEDGEITNIDVIEKAEGAFNDKAEAVACYIKSLEAEAKAIKYEASLLADRAKSKENKADRLRDYLRFSLLQAGKDKLETARCKLSFHKGTKVIIDSQENIPSSYIVTETVSKVNKNEIKAALKNGIIVPGAHLEETRTLQVK